MTKKIVLIDFDGVIVNSFDMALTIAQELHPGMTAVEYRAMFEGNIYDKAREKVAPEHFDAHHQQWFSRYSPQLLKLEPVPEIVATISVLAKRYGLIIVSSSIESPIRQYIDLHNIGQYFEKIFSADTHYSKVEKISMVFNEYHVTAGDCVFVTDTLGDIREATKMNVPSLAVTWGFHDQKTLQQGNPIALVDTPQQLPEKIAECFLRTGEQTVAKKE